MNKKQFNFKDWIIIMMIVFLCIVLSNCPTDTSTSDPTPTPLTPTPTPLTPTPTPFTPTPTPDTPTPTPTPDTPTPAPDTPTPTPLTPTPTPLTPTPTPTPTLTPAPVNMTMGFETSEDMTGWISINADGGYNTQYETETQWRIFNGASYAHSGDRFICSLYNDDGTPNDDYLVTPQILPTSSSSFTMWAAPVDPDNAEESFFIRYSTDMETFTELYYYQYSEGDTNWRQHSVSLSSLADQYVYIAIHCTSNFQYLLRVDDITITDLQSISKSLDNRHAGNSFPEMLEFQVIPPDRIDSFKSVENKRENYNR